MSLKGIPHMMTFQNPRSSHLLRLSIVGIVSLILLYILKVNFHQTHHIVPTQSTPQPPSTAVQSEKPVSGTNSAFPTKVWHSSKTEVLTDTQREWVDSWTEKNPTYRQELLTDRSGEAFVRAHFLDTRPDIVDVYESLSIPILRADLLRYLIILVEGGIWSDLDVTCEEPVSDWIPAEYKDQKIDMVVGLEFDFAWRGPGTAIASQFCNWVFMAKPSSRNLQVIVDSVIETIKGIASTNNVQVKDITLDLLPIDVVDVTGPKIMTVSILQGLSKLLGRVVDDRDFAGIKRPKLVGDVLIMPGVSFAALQNGNPTDQGKALVSHHYAGSWKAEDAAAKERKKTAISG